MIPGTSKPTLEHLHDIVLPDPISWIPQTVGWWIVLVLLGFLLGWAGYATYKRWKGNRYRRLALNQLRQIEVELDHPDRRLAALAKLPHLVKQTVLACWKRSEVASLTGEAWLQFLDESYRGKGFTEGPGRLLPTLAYSPRSSLEQLDVSHLTQKSGLVSLIREWIQRHRV